MKKADRSESEVKDAPGQDVNRRGAPRISAQELPGLGMKLWSGGTVRLLDLSQTGARFEADRRLVPAGRVALQFITSDQPVTVHGRVIRVRLTRVERSAICYEVAVAFDQPVVNLHLPDSQPRATSPIAPAPLASAPPVAEDQSDEEDISEPGVPTGTSDDGPYDDIDELLLIAHVTQSRSEIWQVINGNEW
jgi:hypothetical protein